MSEHGEEIGSLPLAVVRDAPLREQIERIAMALDSAAEGDFDERLLASVSGPLAPIAGAARRLIGQNARFAREVLRVSRRVSSSCS